MPRLFLLLLKSRNLCHSEVRSVLSPTHVHHGALLQAGTAQASLVAQLLHLPHVLSFPSLGCLSLPFPPLLKAGLWHWGKTKNIAYYFFLSLAGPMETDAVFPQSQKMLEAAQRLATQLGRQQCLS